MKILSICRTGEYLALLMRLRAKHKVYLYNDNSAFKTNGEGLVNIVPGDVTFAFKEKKRSNFLEKLFEKEAFDLVLLDPAMGLLAPLIESYGIPTWGANSWSTNFNLNKDLKASLASYLTIPEEAIFGFLWDGEKANYLHSLVPTIGFMPGNLGVRTISSVFLKVEKEKRADLDLSALFDILEKGTYKGLVYASSSSVHFGLDVTFLAPLLEKLVSPEDLLAPVSSTLHLGLAKSLLVSFPPFPSPGPLASPLEVLLPQKMLKHLVFLNAQEVDGAFLFGKHSACVGYITSYGDFSECSRRLQRTAKNLLECLIESQQPQAYQLQYRTDL